MFDNRQTPKLLFQRIKELTLKLKNDYDQHKIQMIPIKVEKHTGSFMIKEHLL